MGGIAHSVILLIEVDTGAVVWISVNAPLYHGSKSGVIITAVVGLETLMVYLANSPMRQLSAEGIRNRDCSIPSQKRQDEFVLVPTTLHTYVCIEHAQLMRFVEQANVNTILCI